MYAIFGAKIMTTVADTPKLLKNIVTYFYIFRNYTLSICYNAC